MSNETRNELSEAARCGDIPKLKLLLQQGYSIEEKQWNETPLFMSCKRASIEAVKFILDNGGKLDTRDSNGWTPLHEACYWGRIDLVTLFLSRGALRSQRNDAGDLPFDVASRHIQNTEILNQLKVID